MFHVFIVDRPGCKFEFVQSSPLSFVRLGPSMDPAMALNTPNMAKAGPRPNEGGPLCPQSPMIPFLLHKMQQYSQYIKGHVG